MSEDEFDFDKLNEELNEKIAAIHSEFDQFKAAISEIAQTVCVYRQELKKSRQFTRDESFALTMEYQAMVLNNILNGGKSFIVQNDQPPELGEEEF